MGGVPLLVTIANRDAGLGLLHSQLVANTLPGGVEVSVPANDGKARANGHCGNEQVVSGDGQSPHSQVAFEQRGILPVTRLEQQMMAQRERLFEIVFFVRLHSAEQLKSNRASVGSFVRLEEPGHEALDAGIALAPEEFHPHRRVNDPHRSRALPTPRWSERSPFRLRTLSQ